MAITKRRAIPTGLAVLAVLGMGAAQAAGLNLPASLSASGSGTVVTPPVRVEVTELVAHEGEPGLLHKVRLTVNRTSPGAAIRLDVFLQLRGHGRAILGPPRVKRHVEIDDTPVELSLNFLSDRITLTDIIFVDVTVCRHPPRGKGFACRSS